MSKAKDAAEQIVAKIGKHKNFHLIGKLLLEKEEELAKLRNTNPVASAVKIQELEKELENLYIILDDITELARKILGYPPDQSKWNDSEPFTVTTLVIPEAEMSDWLQLRLQAMLWM